MSIQQIQNKPGGHGISRFQTPTHRPDLRYIQITIKSIALEATSTQHSIVLSKLCAHEINEMKRVFQKDQVD